MWSAFLLKVGDVAAGGGRDSVVKKYLRVPEKEGLIRERVKDQENLFENLSALYVVYAILKL